MMMKETPLSPDQLEQFHNDGYLIVPNVLSDYDAFCEGVLEPFLEKNDDYLKSAVMATGEYDSSIHTEVPGVMLRNPDNSDPLPDDGQLWVLQNKELLQILHQLHSNNNSSTSQQSGNDHQHQQLSLTPPSWEWLHATNIGWIHVRLPISDASQFEHRWHVDGGHFSPHLLTSPEQSVVVLPMLHDIALGGGNTVVLPGSHHYMAQLIHRQGCDGLPKKVTQDCRKLGRAWPKRKEIAPCQAGDVLIMHPMLVHAGGFHTNGTATKRISFNLGTKWTRPVNLVKPLSWLESSLKRSLTETKGLPELNIGAPFQLTT